MANVKIVVLRFFSSYDATGVVGGSKGDILEVGEGTAKMLIQSKFAKKWRPEKKEKKGE